MSRKTNRPKLILTQSERQKLEKLSRSRTGKARELHRAKILLEYVDNQNITEIQKNIGVSRVIIYKHIDRAVSAGIDVALRDKYHRPKAPVITEEAKTWVINLACTKPTEHGYAAELWTLSAMAKHTRSHAPTAGHTCLSRAVKATIQRILKSQTIKPHKIKYYLVRKDPEFEKKMEEILVVYREVNYQNENDVALTTVTLSIDEKPGIQALKNIAPDHCPSVDKNSTVRRDYEYKRLGTLSLLAAMDLHSGHIIGQVHDRHRSREFTMLLKEIDNYYPRNLTIRLILDNHSAHISKESMAYLLTRPNRFIYVHTPVHGSWLNMIESFFSKFTRSVLKGIRIQSKAELKDRILLGLSEINNTPVVYKWKNFSFDLI